MRKIARVIDGISYYTGYFSGWLVVGVMSLTMIEVITRYVVRKPLMLADEFGGYSYAAISLIGLAYALKEGRHIRIQFVVSRLPVKLSNWLRVITLTMALAYAIIASKVSYGFIFDAYRRHIGSASWLMTPLWIPQMMLPIGFSLLSLVLVAEIAQAVRNTLSGVSTEAISKKKAEEGAV